MRITSLMLLFVFAMNACATPVDKVISFGDSLSDNGNVFRMSQLAHKMNPLSPVFASPPYYQGRLTNGLIWSEYLAKNLSLPLDETGYESYAFAGSWAEGPVYSQLYTVPDILTQVDWFLMRTNPLDKNYDPHTADHLYTFWDGANDYIQDYNGSLEHAPARVVGQIKQSIQKLIDWTHAKRILVLNMPDLGRTPLGLSKSPELAAALTRASRAHNALLNKAVAELRSKNSNTQIIVLDVFKYFTLLIDDHGYEDIVLQNVSQSCYTGTKSGGYRNKAKVCADPDSSLFWDDLHPTRTITMFIARESRQLLLDHNMVY